MSIVSVNSSLKIAFTDVYPLKDGSGRLLPPYVTGIDVLTRY